MKPEQIHTAQEYSAALGEVSVFFDVTPEPGTPEANRLETLLALIKHYEQRRHANEVHARIHGASQCGAQVGDTIRIGAYLLKAQVHANTGDPLSHADPQEPDSH